MVTKDFQNKINAAYNQLEMKQAQIVQALLHGMFEVESGWHNGHYHRSDNGDWHRASYPIPVVSVKGVCDIEIAFDKVSVSTKLERTIAMAYSYDTVSHCRFESFGVKEYLHDFYTSGMTIEEMKTNIAHSDEQEIGFSFIFPVDVTGEEIFEFVKLLRQEGFYC